MHLTFITFMTIGCEWKMLSKLKVRKNSLMRSFTLKIFQLNCKFFYNLFYFKF